MSSNVVSDGESDVEVLCHSLYLGDQLFDQRIVNCFLTLLHENQVIKVVHQVITENHHQKSFPELEG